MKNTRGNNHPNKPRTESYFRAMCEREYRGWEEQGSIDVGAEWAVKKLYQGFPLRELKEWVDNDQKSHDLVIRVNSNHPLEFALATENERWASAGSEGDGYMLPRRYMNQVPLPFERAQVVYDPGKVVSDKLILDLEQIL